MSLAECSVIVIGEGNAGKPFEGLVSLIDESSKIGSIKSEG